MKKEIVTLEIQVKNYEIPILLEYKKQIERKHQILIKNASLQTLSLQYRFGSKFDQILEVSYANIVESVGVEAIVNASNKQLVHSGGVAGMIQKYAGESYIRFCSQYLEKHKKLKTGCSNTFPFEEASQFKYIITTVGPKDLNQQKLRDSIRSVFQEAEKHKIKSIALPIISSGIYNFDF